MSNKINNEKNVNSRPDSRGGVLVSAVAGSWYSRSIRIVLDLYFFSTSREGGCTNSRCLLFSTIIEIRNKKVDVTIWSRAANDPALLLKFEIKGGRDHIVKGRERPGLTTK